MFTPRGITVAVAGVAMWLVARILGSPGLEVVGIGFALLPFIAGCILRWSNQPVTVARHLSDVRVPPGTRLTVQLDVSNPSPLHDVVPVARRPAAAGARAPRSPGRHRRSRRAWHATGVLLDRSPGARPLPDRPADGRRHRRLRALPARLVLESRDELLVTPGDRRPLRAPRTPRAAEASAAARARQLLRRARSTSRCAAIRRATTCDGSIGPRSPAPASS